MRNALGILSILILILANLLYLGDPTFPYGIPLLLALLFCLTCGLFEYRKYYNQIVYSIIITIFLVVIWALTLIQPLSRIVDVTVYRLETVIITLILWGLSLYVLINSIYVLKKQVEYPRNNEDLNISINKI